MTILSQERRERIDNALYKLVVGKVLPPSLVENEHFYNFIRELDPRYKLPNRKKLMSALEAKKTEIQEKIKTDIRACDGIGITHDGWTSASTECYNTTTIHYIDRTWNMKSAVLSTKKMEGSHTSEKLANSLQETKSEWCLPETVATTDNAANERKAFEILEWPRFGCYGHHINLTVKKSLESTEIARLLGKCRRLVTLFHTSSSINDKLKEKQELLLRNLVGHKFIGDVPTKWNSTLAMLQRIIEQMPALMAIATDEQVNKSARTTIKNCLFTFDETTLAEQIVIILEPFKKATEIVCAEKTPTINKVLPVVVKLSRTLDENNEDLPVIRKMKATMRAQMEQRTETEEVAMIGCILSPYTKGFEFLPQKKEAADVLLRRKASDVKVLASVKVKQEPVDQEFQSEMTANAVLPPPLPTLGKYEISDESTTTTSQSSVTGNDVIDQTEETEFKDIPRKKPRTVKSRDTEDWLDDVICTGEEKVDKDVIQSEISRYFGTAILDSDCKKTVLEWWKANAPFFPRLSILARKFLCVQASSVPSERVFSLAGELVSKKRNRLSPNNIDLFIFLNKNMKNFW